MLHQRHQFLPLSRQAGAPHRFPSAALPTPHCRSTVRSGGHNLAGCRLLHAAAGRGGSERPGASYFVPGTALRQQRPSGATPAPSSQPGAPRIPSFAEVLNLLGETAFGDDSQSNGSKSFLGSAYRWLLRLGRLPTAGRRHTDTDGQLDLASLTPERAARVVELCAVFACSEAAILRLAYKHPPALDLSPTDVMTRLIGLKQLLPHCDVLYLVTCQPAAYLGGTPEAMLATVGASVSALREGLRGANVAAVIDQDPGLPFVDIDSGLQGMRSLWGDLDEAALAASEPHHLALAVRALGASGAPKSL